MLRALIERDMMRGQRESDEGEVSGGGSGGEGARGRDARSERARGKVQGQKNLGGCAPRPRPVHLVKSLGGGAQNSQPKFTLSVLS